MANVRIRELDIRLGGIGIIEKLDLEVEDGEFLVLLGPSGCGKSTLLHSIAGLIDVEGGSMVIDDTDVTWADPKDRGIGMVFQSYALYPTMTVEQNMSFGLRIAGVARDEIARRVQRAAKMLHLTELLQRKPAQLSGGQRQRAAIGRALARDARVYLFDEPLSNLDAKLRSELRRELKQLHKDIGTTMIYVTHDQVEAMTLASRIAVMKQGRIQQIGSPQEVYAHPANMFVAGFLGSPSMNFLEGRMAVNGDLHFTSAQLNIDLSGHAFDTQPAHGQNVVLGVRPEALVLLPASDPRAVAHATVVLIEPMGAHQTVWLDAGGISLAAHLETGTAPAEGQRLGIGVDACGLSLFDQESQVRL
ncbi:ATP-binding cassette domain-containing protein [Comamonas composti]|uniref:ATP-binding cassette domain-containing protein n=1 Tax=Comamonas composti TaxID=408558 RepID=UPI000400842C